MYDYIKLSANIILLFSRRAGPFPHIDELGVSWNSWACLGRAGHVQDESWACLRRELGMSQTRAGHVPDEWGEEPAHNINC